MAELFSEDVCLQAFALCVQRGTKVLLKEITAEFQQARLP